MKFSKRIRKLLCSVLAVSFAMPIMAMADFKTVSQNEIGSISGISDVVKQAPATFNRELTVQFINRMYNLVMNRDGEPEGVAYWTRLLEGGYATGGEAIEFFFGSPEFVGRNLNDEQFLDVLYASMFEREPDAQGKAFWLDHLRRGQGRVDIAHGFIASIEWRTICTRYGIIPGVGVPMLENVPTIAPTPTVRPTSTPTPTTTPSSGNNNSEFGEGVIGFVTRLYHYCFGRAPEAGAAEYWADIITSGRGTAIEVAHFFFFSPEYTELKSHMTNDQIIETFYLVFMDRESDASGKAFWLKQIVRDNGYENVFGGFAYSPEFKDICARYGIGAIRNPSNDPEYENWVQYQQRGIDRLNQASLTPHRTYQSINVRGASNTVRTVTISDRDWAVCEQFAATHFDPSWTAGEKVAYTMYWINRNVTYARGDGWNAISGLGYAEAIFVKRIGQCAQYNGALTMMMCYLGYDVAEIVGYRCTNSGSTFSHYWNEVYINGQTYVNECGNYGDSGYWMFLCCVYGEATKFVKNGVRMD